MAVARGQQEAIIFQQIISEFREASSEIGSLRQELRMLKEAIEPVAKIVLRGDGTALSVVTQLELNKAEMGHMSKSIAKNEAKLQTLSDEFEKISAEDSKGRWGVITAIIMAVAALLGTGTAILIAMLRK